MSIYAHSPAYGGTVALGPVQRAVLDIVLELTEGGRRPSLTLGRLSALTGRPVSSVHDAIGRLRALGLIGAVARMGRLGGIRLWRVTSPSRTHTLDKARHRVAIARLLARWYKPRDLSAAEGSTPAPGTRPLWEDGPPSDHAGDDPASVPSEDATGSPARVEPDSEGTGKPWYDRTPETFAEKMKRYGIGEWIDRRSDKGTI